jgi:1,4-alpha-glucan branching enzyme
VRWLDASTRIAGSTTIFDGRSTSADAPLWYEHAMRLAAVGIVGIVCAQGCRAHVSSEDATDPTGAATPPGVTTSARVDDRRPTAALPPPRDPPSGRRLGATVEGDAVVFRVWAPGAQAAWVDGDGLPSRVEMHVEDDLWVARVPSMKAGQTYRYVLERGGATFERLDPYCREIVGNACAVVDPQAYAWRTKAFARPERRASVVYEMHVGSFVVPQGSPQGTFTSARTGLARLADVGVDVVELMPVHAFGGNAAGWGYNPRLFFAPKPTYGTADELRAFVDEAHAQKIAVWLDVVYNHTDGWREAPLRCFDGDCADGSAGVYFFPKGPYATTPWGPRLDYTKRQVRDMVLDSVHAWLTEFRGDGFRWDSTSNIRAIDGQGTTPGGRDLLVRANDWTHDLGGTTVAEDLKGYDALTKRSNDGGFGFDAQWDGFGYAVTDVLAAASDDARDLGRVEGALKSTYAGDPFARLLYLETHDTVGNGGARLPKRIDPVDPTSWAARKRSILGGVLLLTTPGVPMLFQGMEDLATGGFVDPPAPLAEPDAKGLRMRAFYKDMIRLRRNLDGGAGGLLDPEVDVFHRNDAAKVIAYRRHGPSGEDVIVIVNLRNKAYTRYDVGAPSAGAWKIRLDTAWTAYGDDFEGGATGSVATIAAQKDGKPFTLPIALAPYGAVVLTR